MKQQHKIIFGSFTGDGSSNYTFCLSTRLNWPKIMLKQVIFVVLPWFWQCCLPIFEVVEMNFNPIGSLKIKVHIVCSHAKAFNGAAHEY